MELHYCFVMNYDSASGRYTVQDQATARVWEASLLSQTPRDSAGFGLRGVNEFPYGTPCLVVKNGAYYYILGFDVLLGSKPQGTQNNAVSLEPGDLVLQGGLGSLAGVLRSGVILLQTYVKNVRMLLDPVREKISLYARRFWVESMNFALETDTDLIKNQSWLKFKLNKGIDLTSHPKHRTENAPDRLELRIGDQVAASDTDSAPKHIIDVKISSDNVQQDPKVVQTLKIGLNEGKVAESSVISKENADQQVESTWIQKESGELTYKTVGKYEYSVKIDPAGDIIIKTTNPDAKIVLGGTGNEQQLVTKSWVDKVFDKHKHLNGNNGAPTEAPVPITVPAPSADKSNNFFTYTTKAE